MSSEQITNQTYDQIAAYYADRYWNSTLGDKLSLFVGLAKSGGRIVDRAVDRGVMWRCFINAGSTPSA